MTADYAAQFGALVLQQRKSLNITQQALADQIGVAQPHIAKIERGQCITLQNAIALSQILGISLDGMCAIDGGTISTQREALLKRNIANQLRFVIATLEANS